MSVCLQLDHVDYMYGAAKIRVLSDVSADFEAGKMYAITGPSGAGKSTLLSLLAGLDSPSKGVVRFEGGNIAETGYSKHRREYVSLVFQDHNLIDYLTPVENLRLVNPKADLKILEDLGLTREEAKRNIMHLSGGQRQRLTIARALVGSPRIVILDDAASALDFATDAHLRAALRKLNATTTSIIIAQRVAAVMQEDKILVIDHGKQVGLGTHKELLAICPLYKEICLSQLRPEEVE